MTETFNYDLERMKIAVNSPTVKLELYQMNKEILQLIEIWNTSLTDDADFDDELSSLVKLVIQQNVQLTRRENV